MLLMLLQALVIFHSPLEDHQVPDAVQLQIGVVCDVRLILLDVGVDTVTNLLSVT